MTNFEYIFLYCDHWCERCIYTSSCQQFASGTVPQGEWREWSLSPEEFWKNIHLSYQASLERMNPVLAEKGINLAAIAPDLWEKREGEISSLHTKAWPYIGWAKLYGEQVFIWEVKALQDLDYQEFNPIYGDLRKVIQQYQHYIFAKLNRVAQLHEQYAILEEDPEWETEIRMETQKALLAIDRSLGAWNSLFEYQSAEFDAIPDLMVLLLRIRFQLYNNFPGIEAQDFPIFHK